MELQIRLLGRRRLEVQNAVLREVLSRLSGGGVRAFDDVVERTLSEIDTSSMFAMSSAAQREKVEKILAGTALL